MGTKMKSLGMLGGVLHGAWNFASGGLLQWVIRNFLFSLEILGLIFYRFQAKGRAIAFLIIEGIAMKRLFFMSIVLTGICGLQVAHAETESQPPQDVSNIADDSWDNYLSLTYGTVKTDVGWAGGNIHLANDSGVTKQVEFYWGSKKYASYIAGVRTDQNNKISGYLFSYVFNNKDIISINNWTSSGEITLTGDSSNPIQIGTLGKYNATLTELSYISSIKSLENQAYAIWTYGNGNFPGTYSGNQGPLSKLSTFVDASPNTQYLSATFEVNPIRTALLTGKPVRDMKLTKDNFYGIINMGLAVEEVHLSSNQAGNFRSYCCGNPNYYNQPTNFRTESYYNPATRSTIAFDRNPEGLLNKKSALFLAAPFYAEGGLFVSGSYKKIFSAIGTVGIYAKVQLDLDSPNKSNNLGSGISWSPISPIIYGANARLSVLF